MKACDSSIGASHISRASVSLIPLDVGHVAFGCNGSVGGVTVGGTLVSLAVITAFSDSGVLDMIYIYNNSTVSSFRQQPMAAVIFTIKILTAWINQYLKLTTNYHKSVIITFVIIILCFIKAEG